MVIFSSRYCKGETGHLVGILTRPVHSQHCPATGILLILTYTRLKFIIHKVREQNDLSELAIYENTYETFASCMKHHFQGL